MTVTDVHTAQAEIEKPRPPNLVIELAVALFFLGVTAFAFFSSWGFPEPIGDRDPGPAALPRYLSLVGVALSGTLVILTLRRRGGWEIPRPGRPMLVFGWTVVCLIIEPLLGYVVTMTVFMFGITQLLGVRKRWIAGAFSVLAALGTFGFFGDILGIPL